MTQYDRYLGMLVGHHLGDALGAPFEFPNSLTYRGLIEHESVFRNRFMTRVSPVGSVTDDTCMTQALLKSIARRGTYDTEDVVKSYMDWANDKNRAFGMGRNTRDLLKGVTTIKGYLNRWDKKFSGDTSSSQSNGCLMRCSPLCYFGDLRYFDVDCRLTNPSPVATDACIAYGAALWMAVRGVSREEIAAAVPDYVQTQEVRQALEEARRGVPRDTKTNKGWVLHAFYYSMRILYHGPFTFREVVDSLAAVKGDDTDTNAAIAGALAGALEGYSSMLRDETTKYNLSVIQKVNNLEFSALDRLQLVR